MTDSPERKSLTEALDLQRKTEDIVSGKRPVDERYPYIPPDYNIPFLHIGTEKQLFLDNFILDRFERVERVFPKPDRPEQPIIDPMELPWERNAPKGYFSHWAFVVAALHDPDDGKFKLWYIRDFEEVYDKRMLCYAETTAPLHWEKPLSEKCVPFNEHKATNIVQLNSGEHIALALNCDQSDKSRKYLMNLRNSFLVSPDGLQWRSVSEGTPYRKHHYQRPIWDESIQKWISYSQYSHHWNILHRKRQIGRQESADFINWSPKRVVVSVDFDPNLPPNLEFHDMSVRKIGGQYIGIATEFLAEGIPSVHDFSGRHIPEYDGDCTYNHWEQAYAHFGLYASRDGIHWRRVGDPGPWAAHGAPGHYDYGFFADSVAGQLVHDGKTYVIHDTRPQKQRLSKRKPNALKTAEFLQHERNQAALVDALGTYPRLRSNAITALILREDGWAELKPTYEQGSVFTRQFVFEGDTLKVNAEAYGGYLKVEALDPQFKPYEGFSAAECDAVCSDNPKQIWHTVRWRGNPDVRALWNKPVRLRFHLHQASLYAFQFEETATVKR
jgi:hypothetical protein